MKRKGITIWEQHLERFVLGAAVLFFVVFTAMQFLSSPNEVDLGPGETVAPGDVDEVVRARAVELLGQLDDQAAPQVEVSEPAPVAEDFEAAMMASISPADRVAVSHPRIVMVRGIDAGSKGARYVEPQIKAPYSVTAVQDFNALEPIVVQETAGLVDRFPERPYDITWITPVAMFDLAAVRDEFAAGGADGAEPIPSKWYASIINILDVKVEREELADGEWTNLTVLEPLPGAPTFRAELTGDVTKRTRDRMRNVLGQSGAQRAIVQPDFFALKNGVFVPPDPEQAAERAEVVEEMSDEQRELRRLERQLAGFKDRRALLFEKLEELGGRLEDPPELPDGGGGAGGGAPGGGGPPGGGLGAGGGNKGRKGGGTSAANQAKIKSLQGKIRRLDRQIETQGTRVAKLRGDDENEAVAAATDEPKKGLMDRDEIRVWAHDINVVAGSTYRYRFTVELYNPFFARKRNLLEEQRHLAEGITLPSLSSDWSDPQRVIERRRVFITKAHRADDQGGQLELGQARAEVYRFYDGRWWMDTFPVEPGDRIGREELQQDQGAIDFKTDWFVLDIIGDVNASKDLRERGWGARVLLQSVSDPSLTIVQEPLRMNRDLEREQLRDAVDLADLEGDVASSG